MPIVSSSHAVGVAQADGRHYVVEDHLDNVGAHHVVEYLAAAGADYDAIRIARQTIVSAALERNELDVALAGDSDPILVHSTKAILAQEFRERFRGASKEESARLAMWVINRINSGWVTETQVRNVFGLTTGQWTTLRAKLVALRDHWIYVRQASGE